MSSDTPVENKAEETVNEEEKEEEEKERERDPSIKTLEEDEDVLFKMFVSYLLFSSSKNIFFSNPLKPFLFYFILFLQKKKESKAFPIR